MDSGYGLLGGFQVVKPFLTIFLRNHLLYILIYFSNFLQVLSADRQHVRTVFGLGTFQTLSCPQSGTNGLVVECLTQDRGVACLSLIGITALCP